MVLSFVENELANCSCCLVLFLKFPYCGLPTLQVNTHDFVSVQVELDGTKSEENSV